eukprot:NODE_3_length_56144_cov_0.348184.p14 type:complete len:169 gc:universal NODE_3_length_56144_cov_0.348184:184-690(+)
MLLYNIKLKVHKEKRDSLFPLANFTAHVVDYGLREEETITLWAIDKDGTRSEIDLNEYIGFSLEQGKGFHCIKNGKGFYNDYIYHSSKLTESDGYCRIEVTTKDNVVSWLDLDYFIGYVFHKLCTNTGQYDRFDSYYSNEQKSKFCQYYEVTTCNQPSPFSLFGFKLF